ncbi:MAG: ribosome recycling factor [Chloroflexi bacterium]|nr:ribosome recycling factor [Chloroflexota bacterium]
MADAKSVLSSAEERMGKTIEALRRELASIRTGRANPALVDHLRVDYYGTPTPISQVASITAPDARQLLIQPWDRGVLSAIEKAIQKSDLGIMPNNDGSVIRLALPQLTADRRKDLVKGVKKKAEEGKIALRNVRRDAGDELKSLEKSKDISEDEQRRLAEQLQKVTDRFIIEADRVGAAKEQELLEV